MNDFIEALSKYLQNRRDVKRNVYIIMYRIYRVIVKERISYED